jgi:hippurate hydrolase
MKHAMFIALFAALLVAANASAQGGGAAGAGAAQINAIYPDIEKLYIDLHRNPELAFHEQRTAATLAARVKALGYEVTTGVGGTGIVAILKNGPGPVVMLRTELDALPIEEKTGRPFASAVKTKNEAGETVPVAHMCGHDLHMSAWAATPRTAWKRALAWHFDAGRAASRGNRLGRERDDPRRAVHALSKPDYALGLHDDASLPAGVIGFHPGNFRAGTTNLDVTVYGRGGHGAYPQSTIDPIVIASRIVLGLQTIVSRENNPADPAVITVGSIHGGTVWNIIPDQVRLQLTVCSLDPHVQQRLLSAIEREANGEAQAANAPKQPLIETKSSTESVYNDPETTQRAVAAVRAALGADKVVEMPALMGSEDFSQFGLAGVHAVLLHVGAVDAAKLEESRKTGVPLPGVHSPLWAPVREPTIKAAIGAETAILVDLLKSS